MTDTAHPATTYVPTGTNGTTAKPWGGDTYTVLSMKGDIVGWVVYHSEVWRAVAFSAVPQGDLTGAYAILDSIPPSVRRDGYASFHAAWMTVENAWRGR